MKNVLKDLLKNYDESKVNKYRASYEESLYENKIFFINRTTPKEFRQARLYTEKSNKEIYLIDERIIAFLKQDKKTFCWIHGKWGVGKTYSLYAIRNNEIINKENIYFEIKMENELNYDVDFRQINAIDNLTCNEIKIKFLAQFYFNLFDYCWKNKKKLFITATIEPELWLIQLDRFCVENAGAIADRIRQSLEIIYLEGESKR